MDGWGERSEETTWEFSGENTIQCVCVFVSDGFISKKVNQCASVCGCFSVKENERGREERICRYSVLRNRGLEARERKRDFGDIL